MLKPLVSLLFSLFTLQTLFANSNQTIVTGMNFDDAENLLAKSNCTSQIIHQAPLCFFLFRSAAERNHPGAFTLIVN
jgi:hypothetical protein